MESENQENNRQTQVYWKMAIRMICVLCILSVVHRKQVYNIT